MNAGEYVTYLKELTVRIEQSGMSVEFWPAALSFSATRKKKSEDGSL